MDGLGQAAQQSADRNGVPLPLLLAVGQQETGLNPNMGVHPSIPAVGGERAVGMMGLKPSTAKELGISNPADPAQALEGAARYLRKQYDSTGSWDQAVLNYHGGPDVRYHGPRTANYGREVTQKALLLASQIGDTPITGSREQADPTSPQAARDPYLEGLNVAPAANGTDPYLEGVDPTAPAISNSPAERNSSVIAPSAPHWGVNDILRQYAKTSRDVIEGVPQAVQRGLLDVVGGGAWLGGEGMDALGIPSKNGSWAKRATDTFDQLDNLISRANADFDGPDESSIPYTIGRVGGNIAGLGPLTEIAPLSGSSAFRGAVAARDAAAAAGESAPMATRLAAGIARYGDLAAQGGTAGLVLSRGHEPGNAAAWGAVAAPVAGLALEKVIAPAASKLASGGRAIAATLKKAIGSAEAENPFIASGSGGDAANGVQVSVAAGRQPDWKSSDLDITPAMRNFSNANDAWAAELDKATPDKNTVMALFDAKEAAAKEMWADPVSRQAIESRAGNHAAVTGASLENASGSVGNRNGIEGNTDYPQSVRDYAEKLTASGVPADHALREAEIKYVGARPTLAAVTRDRAHQVAVNEGAKLTTPEGKALSDQMAANNDSLHSYAQSIVNRNGGAPAEGELAETLARSLAKASTAAKAKVSQAYTVARLADGEKTVSVDPLRELLATPKFKAPTDAASRELITGTRKFVKQMSQTNGGRFTPDQIEDLRQAANAAYDKMGGAVNDKIGQIKSALDESLDQLESAGPAYKEARALHRAWAEKYDNPKGIADLIRTDAKGEFLNADNWRKAENGILGGVSDKAAIQIIRQLAKNGDKKALSRFKAAVVQKAYQDAAGGPADTAGNSLFSGKKFAQSLNKIGLPKLRALFTKQELSDLATLSRAASHLNEPVPGTMNTSNTASAALNSDLGWRLAKALESKGKKPGGPGVHVGTTMGTGAAVLLGHTVVGPAIGMGVSAGKVGADYLGRRAAAKALAAGLRDASDPAVARAAAKAQADKIAKEMMRRAHSRRAAIVAAPGATASQSH